MSNTQTQKFTDPSRRGASFDLNADEVASQLGWSLDRVRKNAEALGGVKKKWGDGFKRPATWRFPSKGLATRAKAISNTKKG